MALDKVVKISFIGLCFSLFCYCKVKKENSTPSVSSNTFPIQIWTTSADEKILLKPQFIGFSKEKDEKLPIITVDAQQKFQTIDGFGYTLTGGSATLINKMGKFEKAALLQELFGK